jgi:replicative DNA helicase
MATTELKVLNSICFTKDIQPLLAGNNINEMFVGYSDVWQFIQEYYGKHRSIPDTSILEQKFEYFDKIDVPGETGYYVDLLREEYKTSELQKITLKLRDAVGNIPSDRILDGVIKDLMGLKSISTESQDLDITDFDKAVEHYEATKLKAKQMGGVPGIPTGISFIDSAYTSGLVGGDLAIVLGWTGRAKSLLTTMIAINAFNHGHRPMIVSMEMKCEKVRDRAYTMMGHGLFKNSDLANGDVEIDDFKKWSETVQGKGFNIVAHNGDNVTPAYVQSKYDQYLPSIIILDYAQLMTDNANSSDMVARMRNMADEYKRMAVAKDIPIILISSATPDNTSSINHPPIVEQIAWSKQLAFNADLAFAVHRHDGKMEDGSVIIEIVGRKNRNGELFSGYFRANINTGIYEEFFSLEQAMGLVSDM